MSNSNDTALIALAVHKIAAFRAKAWKRIEAFGAQVAELSERIAADAKGYAARHHAVEQRASSLETRANRLEGDTASNAKAIGGLQTASGEHTEQLSALSEQIDQVSKEEGPIGPMPTHEWDGTRIRFETAPGVWGPWVDIKGENGAPGPMPNHQWNGTRIRFQTAPGRWGPWVDLAGETRVIPGAFGSGRGGGDGRTAPGGGVDPAALANALAFAAAQG